MPAKYVEKGPHIKYRTFMKNLTLYSSLSVVISIINTMMRFKITSFKTMAQNASFLSYLLS